MDVNLLYGDCLKLMKDISDESVDMILCDLPYGTTANKWDSRLNLEKLWSEYNRIVKENGAVVMFAQQPFTTTLISSNVKIYRYNWSWIKEQGTGFFNAKKAPLKNVEDICVFYKKLPTYNPQMRTGFKPYKIKKGHHGTSYCKQDKREIITESNGERYPLTTLEFKRDTNKVHPTQKPVALLEYLIKTYTNENEVVLDNTMGSGSTGVAAVNTNRNFIGIELDDKYFDIAKRRISEAQNKHEQITIG